jgi:uncharacterized lipoprotein YmbA
MEARKLIRTGDLICAIDNTNKTYYMLKVEKMGRKWCSISYQTKDGEKLSKHLIVPSYLDKPHVIVLAEPIKQSQTAYTLYDDKCVVGLIGYKRITAP